MGLVGRIKRLVKLGKIRHMKNERKKGKSARNGNAPAPYTKYKKVPYKYSFDSKKVIYMDDYNDKQKDAYKNKKKHKKAA